MERERFHFFSPYLSDIAIKNKKNVCSRTSASTKCVVQICLFTTNTNMQNLFVSFWDKSAIITLQQLKKEMQHKYHTIINMIISPNMFIYIYTTH